MTPDDPHPHHPDFFQNLRSEFSGWRTWADRAIVLAYAVASGLFVVGFTMAVDWAFGMFRGLYNAHGWAVLVWTPAVTAAVAWATRRWFPGASGSGIPQVKAALHPTLPPEQRGVFASLRLTLAKIVLGVGGFAAGLSLGREGPSVQVAAGVMQHARRWLSPGSTIDTRALLVAGGAAGIAAAFNAPLAGVVFAIEELAGRLETRSSGLIITAIVLAGLVAVSAFGNLSYFGVIKVQRLAWDLLAPGLPGATVSGMFPLAASASINATRVEYYCDGGVALGTNTTAPAYSVSCDTTKIANGSHSLYAKAYNAAGSSTNSASVTVTVNNTTSTSGQLQWVRTNSGPGSAQVTSVKTDHAGNAIVAGFFSGTVDFGGGAVSSQTSLNPNMFLAKYGPQGGLLWVKTFGAIVCNAYSLAIDSADNIIVTGYFGSSADFGGTTITGVGSSDIFLAKYSSSGVLLWAKGFGGYGSNWGQAVAVDTRIDPSTGRPYDSIFLAAEFQGSIDFGTGALTSAGGDEIALVKFSSAGVAVWAKRYGDTGYEYPQGMALDRFGDILLTGDVFGTANVGGGSVVTPSVGSSIFFAKYSGADGSHKWSKILVNANYDSAFNNGYGVAADPTTGNAVFTGGFYGAMDFGGGSIPSPTSNNGGVFLVAYDPSGNFLWANSYGKNGDIGQAVTIDQSGNIVFSGEATGLMNLPNSGLGYAYFIAKGTLSGNSPPVFSWAKRSPSGNGYGTGVDFDLSGHIIMAGSFYYTVDFGGVSATGNSQPSAFVAQYNQ